MLFCARLRPACLAAALLIASPILRAEPTSPVRDPLGSHVRGSSPAINELIARGAARSATFKQLIDELNKTDVVVYLETNVALPVGLEGRLMFLTAAGGVRYLHAQVASGLRFEELIAIAGHELQHALEVAAHPRVRDAHGMRALYERIGIRSGTPDRYDTAEAQSTGRRVRAEMTS
jgi:hypothetical protein